MSGTIMEAVGHAAWHVLWDDSHLDEQTAHPSSVLKFLGNSKVTACISNKRPSTNSNEGPLDLAQPDSSSEDEPDNQNDFSDNRENVSELIERIETYDREVMEVKKSVH